LSFDIEGLGIDIENASLNIETLGIDIENLGFDIENVSIDIENLSFDIENVSIDIDRVSPREYSEVIVEASVFNVDARFSNREAGGAFREDAARRENGADRQDVPTPPPGGADGLFVELLFGVAPKTGWPFRLEPDVDMTRELLRSRLIPPTSIALLGWSRQRLAGPVVGLVGADVVSPLLAGQIPIGRAASLRLEMIQV
jgi:hypothetical protein